MSSRVFLGAALDAWWRDRHGSAESVARVQQRRLSRLVAHAQQQVPLYRNLYAGIDPARIDLQTLPVVDKALLLERFADTQAGERVSLDEVQAFAEQAARGELLRDRWMLFTTSGTTGRVGYFLVDATSWARQVGVLFTRVLRERLTLLRILRYGPWRPFRMAHLVATGGPYISFLFSQFRTALTGIASRQLALSITAPREQTLQALAQYRPHYLHGYTSYIEMLAREQLAGRLHLAPEVISLGSEAVTALARRTLQRAFPTADVRETYGATECPAIANQCHLGRLHLNSDACLLEPVDDQGRPVPPGQVSSRILLTNLLNWGQPIIRYEMTDQVAVEPEPCACGKPFPVIRVIGRTDDTLTLRRDDGGVEVCPPIPFEVLFLEVPGLAQYQLEHEGQNRLRVCAVVEAGADGPQVLEQLQARLRSWLTERGLQQGVQARVERVDAIARDPRSHKVRQIVSRVPMLAADDSQAVAVAASTSDTRSP